MNYHIMANQTVKEENKANNLGIPCHSRDFEDSPASVKIEIEDEENYFFCNKCRKKCMGLCKEYVGLTHLLNRTISPSNCEWKRGTIPICLAIRNTFNKDVVFALRSIPENVIFGPFKGILPLESINGYTWRMKDGKLLNTENGNWMQYVNSAETVSTKNLDVFQFEGNLYFQTNKEINKDEDLLIHYNKEDILKAEGGCENYIPLKGEKSQEIYACTFCCLGFRLREYLIQHKHRCRAICDRSINETSDVTLEIVQCKSCKIWLEQDEYFDHHKSYCVEDPRICNYPAPIVRINPSQTNSPQHAVGNDENLNEVPTIPNTNSTEKVLTEKRFKCTQCPYRTNRKIDLKIHEDIHTGVKRFQCEICQMQFGRRSNLNRHVDRRHTDITEKHFKCKLCQFETHREEYLTKHTETKHVEDVSRKFKCQRCSYETVRKDCFENHLKIHGNVKPFRCEMCKIGFNYKSGLGRHLKNKHTEAIETPDAFECEHCDVGFGLKSELKQHVNDVHREKVDSKEYRCVDCVYQTNDKSKLKRHLRLHVKNEIL